MSDMSNTTTFTATGTIATFIVPATGTYYISAYGAQGGTSGYGGWAAGDVYLTQGETLDIAVGEVGQPGEASDLFHPIMQATDPSAGGGSFVVLVNGVTATPLVVAGGGGDNGGGGVGPAGGGASPTGDGDGSTVTGGGAGFFSNGAGTASVYNGSFLYITGAGPEDFANGLAGGGGYQIHGDGEDVVAPDGGFGGGGALGGGGYTGGDPGEGGSSYVAPSATDPILVADAQIGNGFAEITYPACFAAGTRIATPDGHVAVETLRVGDLVLSARRQRAVAVRWIGSRRVTRTCVPEPAWACPVRVAAGAFGPGQPARDLLLSPDHAVFAEGVLIPIRALVNDDSVARHPIETVTYYHVQVDEHDILLADGLQVESLLDTGQMSLPGAASRIWEAAGCAPLCITGPEVEAVRAMLAGALCRAA